MKAAFLPDRGVIKVSGDDARNFLNGLLTTDVERVQPGIGRFGALLTPQGKIIVDFLITEIPAGHGGGFLLDCPKELAKPLADRLSIYKLRAKVVIENLGGELGVLALWGGEPAMKMDLMFADPRSEQMGWRLLVPAELASKAAIASNAELTDEPAYESHRIALGIPRGGPDFIYSDAFPHDANMDRLHGVDFEKGCYVGQEVVSRMQHRGTARTRVVRVHNADNVASGASISAADKSIGTMGSSVNGEGLALVRIDRAADALEAQLPFLADGHPISFIDPGEIQPPKKASV
ncbi:MAG: folate-binding protein [Xanthobacteraceae bacterium]|nr:folate-binding protein [Xanthobacteraceae bacterium]